MIPGETVLSGNKSATIADFEVMQSAAGFYIGTADEYGCPNTRETGYFETYEEADIALTEFSGGGKLYKRR